MDSMEIWKVAYGMTFILMGIIVGGFELYGICEVPISSVVTNW